MPLSHILLALLVMGLWGSNFVVQFWAVHLVPPLLFATLRFATVCIPLLFLYPRCPTRWSLLIPYALASFTLQFALLFLALHWGMPPGIASLVMQSQIFFTLLLLVAMGESRPLRQQWVGICLGAMGMAWVGFTFDLGVGLIAFLMTIGAACSWAIGNVFVKRMGSEIAAVPLVVWGSGIGALGLLPISLALEGSAAWTQSISMLMSGHAELWAYLLFNAFGASLIGYGGWSWLLKRHPAASVVPFTLLVPFFGMGSAALLLKEAFSLEMVPGIVLALIGLALTQVRVPRAHTA